MDDIIVRGNSRLNGEMRIQGCKNSVLAIMAAAVLINGISVIKKCPLIEDVFEIIKILKYTGCNVFLDKDMLVIDSSDIRNSHLPSSFDVRTRAMVGFLGSLTGRCRECAMPGPGGCNIGKRPIDLHILNMKKLGCQIETKDNMIYASCKDNPGGMIELTYPSVGATENLIMFSVLSDGITIIENAAREPEIIDMCSYLTSAGADITGAGSSKIVIKGVKSLHDVMHEVSGDRIVAGTYLTAASVNDGGTVTVSGIVPKYQHSLLCAFYRMGCMVKTGDDYISVKGKRRPKPCNVYTSPYPGFPTDMQSQMMVALSFAAGESVIIENIFEDRLKTAYELNRMGADIRIKGRHAYIKGVDTLKGCELCAKDLRQGAALVIAGLFADGESIINNAFYIKRGYEDIAKDLNTLGANVQYR